MKNYFRVFGYGKHLKVYIPIFILLTILGVVFSAFNFALMIPLLDVLFDQVLMISKDNDIQIGQPMLSQAKVIAEVVDHGRAEKIKTIKLKRRKHHMKRLGHRQHYTAVKIKTIQTGE